MANNAIDKTMVENVLRQGFSEQWKIGKFKRALKPYVGNKPEDVRALQSQVILYDLFTWIDVDNVTSTMMEHYGLAGRKEGEE